MPVHQAIKDLLGESILDNSGKSYPVDSFEDKKYFGLYFSGKWCVYCVKFSPFLDKFYNSVKDEKKFEIVFFSADSSQQEFDSYFATMPWKALSYGNPKIKEASMKFQISGFPTLVIVDSEGNFVCNDGVSMIYSDAQGKDFPWALKPCLEALGETFVDNKKNTLSKKQLQENDCVGLYFSASWCPPCRNFTPILAKTYNNLKEQNKKFEIIFISSDKDKEQFEEYFAKQPWLAIPFEDKSRKLELGRTFNAESLPTLIFINPKTGETINENGKLAVMNDPTAYPFLPSPYYNLIPDVTSFFDTNPCFILLADRESSEEGLQKLKNTLLAVATQFHSKYTEQKKEILKRIIFIFASPENVQISASIRGFLKLQDVSPLLAVMNLSQQKVFSSQDVSEQNLRNVAENMEEGKLEMSDLQMDGDDDEF